MKRAEKEITDRGQIDEIIDGCDVCHLAFAIERDPYVIPISFGYDGQYLYIHTAGQGKKLDIIAANPRVCFEMEREVGLVTDDVRACKWTFRFESVVGFGTVEELTTDADKAYGLNQVMAHYSGKDWQFGSSDLAGVRVWRITVDSLTGKRSG